MVIMYSQLTQEVRIVYKQVPEEYVHYKIMNADGLVIRKGKLSPGNMSHNISTNGLPAGRYQFEAKDATLFFDKRMLFD